MFKNYLFWIKLRKKHRGGYLFSRDLDHWGLGGGVSYLYSQKGRAKAVSGILSHTRTHLTDRHHITLYFRLHTDIIYLKFVAYGVSIFSR